MSRAEFAVRSYMKSKIFFTIFILSWIEWMEKQRKDERRKKKIQQTRLI
jgi:hypothetical protein